MTALKPKCAFCKDNKELKEGGCQAERDGDCATISSVVEPGARIKTSVEVCDDEANCEELTCTCCTEEPDAKSAGGPKSGPKSGSRRRHLGSMDDLSCPVNWSPGSDELQRPMELPAAQKKLDSSIVEAGKQSKIEIKLKNIGPSSASGAALSDTTHELLGVMELPIKEGVGACSFSDPQVNCTLDLPSGKSAKVEAKLQAKPLLPPQLCDQVVPPEGRCGHLVFASGHALDAPTVGEGLAFLGKVEPGDWLFEVVKDDKVKFTPPDDSDPIVLKPSCSNVVVDEWVNPEWSTDSHSAGGKGTCSAVVIENKACIVGANDKMLCDAAKVTIAQKEDSKSSKDEDDRLVQGHAIDARRHLLRNEGI